MNFNFANKYLEKIRNNPKLIKAKTFVLPGFSGVPIYEVAKYFFRGILQGSLSIRASAVAFNFFLAIFPAIIFFFTLIPYIPVDNLQDKLLELMKDVLPQPAFELTQSTIIDLISKPRGGLLSFGVLMILYFSTSGFDALSDAFNSSFHAIEKRSFFTQKLISFFLVVITSILIILSLALLIAGQWFLNYAYTKGFLNSAFLFYVLIGFKWLILLALCFFGISIIYFFAPSRANRFRFFSAGSTFATFLMVVSIIGFNLYIKHFASYNALYGSIGTLIIIMMLIYLNALILITGFELNASISAARHDLNETNYSQTNKS